MTSHPILSIGMIVKNEERCLEKCLKALEPIRNAIPTEIVIADTGSTDNTKEIAQKFADILFDFKWVNDFSKARNAVMERCKGKWFLTIDADEYFDGNVDSLVKLVTESSYDKFDVVNVVIRNYTDVEMKSTFSDFYISRIFRLGKGYKYVKPIHEFIPVDDISKSIILPDIIFNHDGYAVINPTHLKNKTKRNLELLEKELAENPNDTRVISEILDSVYLFKDESIRYSEIAIKHLKNLPENSQAKKFFGPVISRRCLRYATENNHPDTSEWIDFVLKNFSGSYFVDLDVNYICTEYFYEKGNFEKALKHGKAYLDTFKKYENLDKSNLPRELLASSLITSHFFHMDKIELILADIYLNLNDKENAIFHLKRADISTSSTDNFERWFKIAENYSTVPEVKENFKHTLSGILISNGSGLGAETSQYNYIVSYSREILNSNCKSDILELYSTVNDTLGISAKILLSDNKNDIEEVLSQLDDAKNFSAKAFNKLVSLGVKLPDSLYDLSSAELTDLFSALKIQSSDVAENILSYTQPETIETLPQCSFALNLIANSWLYKSLLPKEFYKSFTERFYEISRILLTNLYRPEILECDDVFFTLPSLHRFAIFFVIALDSENPEEKRALLLKALEESPEMKNLIDFSLE